MIGQVVLSYRIVRLLGEGGMGRVYAAEHISLQGKRAAIKVLLPRYSQDPEIVARFTNEARAAAQINHPGIINVLDVGQLPDGSAFILMEYLDGESLAARIRREGRLSSELTVSLMAQAVDALGAAHQREIVHRDLKPDNIFLTADAAIGCGWRVKVLDFGIAKLTQDSGVRTGTAVVIGTPAYMSPEQCRSAGRADHRSDIYSLGCIMFEMLTGRTPFIAKETGEYIAAHIKEAAPTPRAIDPTIPEALDSVVRRCLEKHPENRFQSMGELAALLEPMPRFSVGPMPAVSWDAVRPATPPPAVALPARTTPAVPAAVAAAERPTTIGGSAGESVARPPSKSRRGAILAGFAGLAVTLIVAGTAAIVSSSRSRSTAAPKPASAPTSIPSSEPRLIESHTVSVDAGVARVDPPSEPATKTEQGAVETKPVASEPAAPEQPKPARAGRDRPRPSTRPERPPASPTPTPTRRPTGDSLVEPYPDNN